MKMRRKNVQAKDQNGLVVDVNIRVQDTNHRLTNDELDRITSDLTDKAMTNLVNAPFLMCPLHKIKVTR